MPARKYLSSYHHSAIFGNDNETFCTFYMHFDETTVLESVKTSTKDILEVVILNTYSTKSVRQGIRIDKRSGQTVVTLSEKTSTGFLDSDFWTQISGLELPK